MICKNKLMLVASAITLCVAMSPEVRAQENPAETQVVQPQGDLLPVPTGESAESSVVADAPQVEVIAPASEATQVGSYNPRGTDRIVTLRDAVAVGVLTNPETEAVDNNRRATDEELNQAKALYLPSLDLRADTGYESRHSDPHRGFEGGTDVWRSQTSLTLTQMLFDGFSTKYENERQYHRVRSASHRVRETAEFLGVDIIQSYLDVLRQRELLAIAEENLNQHRQIMAQIQESADAGRSTEADVQQTSARLNAAEAQESSVRQSLMDSENAFRRIVGDVPQLDIQVPVAPKQLLSSNVEDEVKLALTHSPTLDIKEADVNVADAEREAAKSSLYPQVDFQASTSMAENLSGVKGRTSSATAMVVADWNLYRGGGDIARTREFVYRFAEAKSDRAATARAIEEDVRQTWSSMNASATRAEVYSKQADANAQVVQAYKDQFNLDRRTLLDVLDSQNEWFVSRSNAINNGYVEMFAVYRLLALRGELLPTLGVAYPKEANPADKS